MLMKIAKWAAIVYVGGAAFDFVWVMAHNGWKPAPGVPLSFYLTWPTHIGTDLSTLPKNSSAA